MQRENGCPHVALFVIHYNILVVRLFFFFFFFLVMMIGESEKSGDLVLLGVYTPPDIKYIMYIREFTLPLWGVWGQETTFDAFN